MLKIKESILQRSDFTFKFNQNLGRHGWLRLTPAYSVKLVKSLISNISKETNVLDPFSGTATTGLVAAENGNNAITFDINPFLIWFGNIKCKKYSNGHIEDIEKKINAALLKTKNCVKQENWIPPIFNIERWWTPNTLKILASIRACLVEEFDEPKNNLNNGLAWVAFCRLIIETSSAAFNHVSMSFKEHTHDFDTDQIILLYKTITNHILDSCKNDYVGNAKVLHIDARKIPSLEIKFGKVITSPPYPNRMSYIRELRPYMYWMKFLEEAKEAGELDWNAIGGTWGIATSRLSSWKSQEEELPAMLYFVYKSISNSNSKNGQLLANYVLKYFHDMHLHLRSIRDVLTDEAQLHYIVGNSTFFGNMVDTAAILKESMKILGFSNIKSEIIRKRNCNKALYEYNISAMWS